MADAVVAVHDENFVGHLGSIADKHVAQRQHQLIIGGSQIDWDKSRRYRRGGIEHRRFSYGLHFCWTLRASQLDDATIRRPSDQKR